MLCDKVKSLIHLNLMQEVGSKTVQQLVNIFGSAVEALKTPSGDIQAELRKVGITAPPGLVHRSLHYELDRELELIHQHGCSVVTLYDEEYPPLLKNIDTPPPVLYIKGELTPKDANSISVVGPRNAKDYGSQVSFQLSSQIAKNGLTIVSGLAKGIDACAHRGALDVKGRTIAVLGNGLSRVYPHEHRELAEEIMQTGALISEFPMDIGPESKNFPKRNRIISGLTLGTVVIEAPVKSGSLITAEHAHKQGRKVFAVPDQILSGHSSGCHKLINDGAMLVETADDLLRSLSHYIPHIPDEQPRIQEPPGQGYLFEPPPVPSEVIVENAVVEYFKTKFREFTIGLQREIPMGSYKGRADVVLIDADGALVTIVECKRSGHIGAGVEQLHSYLSASNTTRFGIFANSSDPDSWTFYESLGQKLPKMIDRSEFEKGVIRNNTIRKS